MAELPFPLLSEETIRNYIKTLPPKFSFYSPGDADIWKGKELVEEVAICTRVQEGKKVEVTAQVQSLHRKKAHKSLSLHLTSLSW